MSFKNYIHHFKRLTLFISLHSQLQGLLVKKFSPSSPVRRATKQAVNGWRKLRVENTLVGEE